MTPPRRAPALLRHRRDCGRPTDRDIDVEAVTLGQRLGLGSELADARGEPALSGVY
jgi:hypothetical protein